MGVVDASNEVFGEPRLTGEIEADVASKSAVGEPRVAHPHRFLQLLFEDAITPEGAVQLAERVAKDGRALLVLNDPCHNPTGYSMTPTEWRDVATVVAEHAARC